MKSTAIALVFVSVICLTGCPDDNTGSTRFVFTDVDPKKTFVFELVDQDKIAHARRILSGEEKARVQVQGTIVKSKASYNSAWSYHLDPDSVDFFELAIEVCDSTMQYVEDHLAEVGGSFLPKNHWCPWTSKLVREL